MVPCMLQRRKFHTTCPDLYRNNITTLRDLSGILQPEIKWRNRFGAQILPLSNVILEKASKKKAKTVKKYVKNTHLCVLLRYKLKVEYETHIIVF